MSKFTKEWRNKAQNLLVFAHLAESGKCADITKDVGKSWTLLAKALLEACDRHDDLLAACKRGHQRLLEMGQKESHRTVGILRAAIDKAEQKRGVK